jgi:DNA repair exonuclease SbcCD ATPase subunit
VPRINEPVLNLKASGPSAVAAKPKSRDPRLLDRIITSDTGPLPNVLSASLAGSPSMIDSAIDGTSDLVTHSYASSAVQAADHAHQSRQQNIALLASGSALGQHASSATRLLMLLGSLFEHASNAAALKHEHKNAEAKAAHQANLDKKTGDLSKSYPAYAEFSAKAKKHIEKTLAVQQQKLAEHQQAQNELLSTMPGIFHAAMASVTTERERQQTEIVRRCISICEDFKNNLDDVKKRFEQHRRIASEMEKAYQSMESRVNSSASQIQHLSSQYEGTQAQYTRLDDEHHKLDASVKLFGEETRIVLASLKNNDEEILEQKRQLKLDLESATNEVGILKQGVENLESQYQILLDSDAVHSKRSEELNKLADMHSLELKELKAMVLQNNGSSDAAHSLDQHIQDLRQELSDARIQREELSALKTDFAALKTEFLGLNKDSAESDLPRGNNDDISMKTQSNLTNLEIQLKHQGENIAEIQQQLLERQKVEEERDDLVVAQVEENRTLTTKVQSEVGQRIESLDRDIQRQKEEGTEQAQKLQKLQELHDSLSQLLKGGSQIPNPRISPISTPPTPQLNRLLQPQAKSSSPQPLIPGGSDMMKRRLETVENLLSATAHQLQAVSLAHRQLDQRYTNISTEPVVRAMVQQMQWLYPFASEAQKEIAHIKQTIEPSGRLASHLDNIEARVRALEREMTGSDGKHSKLIEHIKEEGKRLVGGVENQKDTVNSLVKRVQQLEGERKGLTDGFEGQKQHMNGLVGRLWLLEQHRDAEPDKLKFIADTLAQKCEAEISKTIEAIIKRLDVLETSTSHQDLLKTFTAKIPAVVTTKAVDRLQELHDNDEIDDTDDSSLPLLQKSNSIKQQSSPGPLPPTPNSKGLGKSFLKTRAATTTARKRKRFGSLPRESDDETYAPPAAHSSSSKRKSR